MKGDPCELNPCVTDKCQPVGSLGKYLCKKTNIVQRTTKKQATSKNNFINKQINKLNVTAKATFASTNKFISTPGTEIKKKVTSKETTSTALGASPTTNVSKTAEFLIVTINFNSCQN